MNEIIFKVSITVLLAIFSVIKYKLTMKHQLDGEIGIVFAPYLKIMLALSSIGMLFLPLIYAATEWLDYFEMELIDPIRIAAILAYIGVIIYMLWIMRTLSVNIALQSEKRYLVTTGPYKYVRHPLYGTFVAMSIVQTLIASNWLLLTFVPIIYVAMRLRLPQEEGSLIDEYSDEYLAYKKRTGAFFPKIL